MGKFHGMTRFTTADFNKGILDGGTRSRIKKVTQQWPWTLVGFNGLNCQWVPLLHKMSFRGNWMPIFLDVAGVTGIADDMIIYGRSDLEHDKHLINFLEVCRKNTLTLNLDKMQLRLPQVSFLGHQWSGAQSRSKENCSREKDESTQRCGDNEEFPRSCELSQQI